MKRYIIKMGGVLYEIFNKSNYYGIDISCYAF